MNDQREALEQAQDLSAPARTKTVSSVQQSAVLVLEDGTAYRGQAYGAVGSTFGEIVFSTGMTGYQETLTDPSYARQIIVQTAPHIGNTGVNDEDQESVRIWAAGYVVRDPARRYSNWRAERSLDEELVAQGIVGIQGIDTRAVTRRIREEGAMRAGVFSGEQAAQPVAELVEQVRNTESMVGANLISEVTTQEPYTVTALGEEKGVVVALDLGIKAMTPRRMAERGLTVHVLPASATLDQVLQLKPDGVFYSNGPGDPSTADSQVTLLRDVLEKKIPFFGICLGNQLLGRALGFGTYKLGYGHRGINQPVLDTKTKKVHVTSQNHGFALDAPTDRQVDAPYGEGKFGRVEVSHISLNDNVVEGIRCLDIPAFSVQYHPEAAAGPHDADYLFDLFVSEILTKKDSHASSL